VHAGLEQGGLLWRCVASAPPRLRPRGEKRGGLLAGRRDDLWSWLYLLVEMLAGGLPWREPGGRGEPGDGGEPGDAPGREAAKAAVLAHKQRCLARPADLGGGAPLQGAPPPPGFSARFFMPPPRAAGPRRWPPERLGRPTSALVPALLPCRASAPGGSGAAGSVSGPVRAGGDAVARISEYLAGLRFDETPAYGFLRACLAGLAPPAGARGEPGSAGACPPAHAGAAEQGSGGGGAGRGHAGGWAGAAGAPASGGQPRGALGARPAPAGDRDGEGGAAGSKPPGYYWGSPFNQPAAHATAAGLGLNGGSRAPGSRLAGEFAAASASAPGFANGGDARFASQAAYPASASDLGRYPNPSFDETPMSPPEEDRGAPPRGATPSGRDSAPGREPDHSAHRARASGAGARDAEGGAPAGASPHDMRGAKRARYAPPSEPGGRAGAPQRGAACAHGDLSGPAACRAAYAGAAAGGGAGGRLAGVAAAAADVAAGRASGEALAVRGGLRALDPAEGLALVAWLLDELARGVAPAGAPLVRAPPEPSPREAVGRPGRVPRLLGQGRREPAMLHCTWCVVAWNAGTHLRDWGVQAQVHHARALQGVRVCLDGTSRLSAGESGAGCCLMLGASPFVTGPV